jgi:hypothetical protein
MAEFSQPFTERERGWLELRERLSRAARETHFFAYSNDAAGSPGLLVISANLAALALSIPMVRARTMSGGLVEASTLFATQILQCDPPADGRPGAADLDF